MKLFVVLFFVASATAGNLQNTYLPPNSAASAGGSGLSAPIKPLSPVGLVTSARFSGVALAPTTLYAAPVSYSAPATPPVPILKLNNDNNGDGSYRYEYETANHIAAQESGSPVGPDSIQVQGGYSYLAPNGQTITVNYVADENGFRPIGDHLPTPPPVPEAILKSLEINAAEEARGIVDDGQYRGAVSPSRQYLTPSVNSQYLPPGQQGGYRY
ncbi:endocuticle structural glycoprotein SgAbd-2-like [Anoplophora glabripennis]|uniref:endocuticle structural glycoprotein SgAbd-2-like n=1 Tax=Anoplophora glabripennis TaxID=217634 RepID=UPI000873DF21|nr:endocuticle structural glycoprotein SgAbd-2-like [Anoplophora glabripennis]